MEETRPAEASADFEEMYRREIRAMIAVATALCGSRSVGEEVAQEAMLRAYRDWDTIGGLDRPGAWVRRVVINLAIDVRRRAGRERTVLRRLRPVESTTDSMFGSDPEFWKAVGSLPARQRIAVVLRYVDDLSIEQIGEVMEISPGTAKSTLFAARQSLAGQLGAEMTHGVNDGNA